MGFKLPIYAIVGSVASIVLVGHTAVVVACSRCIATIARTNFAQVVGVHASRPLASNFANLVSLSY